MLVDDHAGMREALRNFINAEPDLIVVAEVKGGQAALESVARTKPDIVLMDGSMPEMTGMEATRQLKRLRPELNIVGLTLYDEDAYVQEMIAAGAKGYVVKTGTPTMVIEAIRTVAAGGTFFDNVVSGRSGTPVQDKDVVEQLSADELAVVKRLAEGRTNTEIAADLEFSLPAVENYRFAAMKKLGLRNRAELVRVAVQRQWLNS